MLKNPEGRSKLSEFNLCDLSFKGFSFYANEALEVGMEVAFELRLIILNDVLSGKGRVRHAALVQNSSAPKFKTGIEFVDVDKDELCFFIMRVQSYVINEIRREKKIKPIDFLPY